METNNTRKAIVPVSQTREIAADRSVDVQPVNLAGAVGSLVDSMRSALSGMQPDDVSIEVDAHSDAERSTARIRLRAYKRRAADNA